MAKTATRPTTPAQASRAERQSRSTRRTSWARRAPSSSRGHVGTVGRRGGAAPAEPAEAAAPSPRPRSSGRWSWSRPRSWPSPSSGPPPVRWAGWSWPPSGPPCSAPLVALLQRVTARGAWRVAVALLVAIGRSAAVAYVAVEDLGNELDRVQRIAPRAAGELERSDRFGEFAREIELRDRVDAFVDELPDRLRGGDPARPSSRRRPAGVSFLITFVLLLFLLARGPKFFNAGLNQIDDEERRAADPRRALRRLRPVLALRRRHARPGGRWPACSPTPWCSSPTCPRRSSSPSGSAPGASCPPSVSWSARWRWR